MFYVVRKNKNLSDYHSAFHLESDARKYATQLKAAFGHNYDVVKVSTVWTTQTMHEAMTEEGAL